MPLRIRSGGIDDIDDLVRLEENEFGADGFGRGQVRYLLEKAQASTHVAAENGRVIASATMLWRRGSRIGRLYSIAVDQSARGKGIGSRLLEKCESEAAARGCNQVILEVRADNRAAIALYNKFGYRPGETLPGYYADGSNGLRMRKSLQLTAP